MDLQALSSLPSAATLVTSAVASKNPAFKATLQKLATAPEDAARRHDAEEAAAGLVSNALILPILKQVRRSTFNTQGPFSAGTGEKTFGPEFDMQIADSIAHSPHLGIRKALADRMIKKGPQKMKAAHKGIDVHG